MNRALIAAVLVLLSACGSARTEAASMHPYVPWVARPAAHHYVDTPTAAPVAAPPVPLGTPACAASQLEGVVLGFGVGMGNVDMPLLLRNKSETGCFLEGYPRSIAVVSSTGRSLTASDTAATAGSYFDGSESAGKVMLSPNTAPLPPPGSDTNGALGQAYVNFSWYDCRQELASALVITLPSAGGAFKMPFAVHADASPACQAPGSRYWAAMRGYFKPAGVSWAPALRPVDVEVTIAAAGSASRRSTLVYFVTLQNVDERAYEMRPCADYAQYLGKSQLVSTYQLNCDPVGSLRAGGSATFEMHVAVPEAVDRGQSEIAWCLDDGRIGNGCGVAGITIT